MMSLNRHGKVHLWFFILVGRARFMSLDPYYLDLGEYVSIVK